MSSDWMSGQVREHLDTLVPPRPPEMQVMEDYAREHNFPIIGPAAGYFCYQIARMVGAQRIFELGSGYGYSTAWFARAVHENGGGKVYHVVWSDDLSRQARVHLGRLGYADIVEYRVGEAVQVLNQTDGPFDLIFNDIDKPGYPASLLAIAPKLRPRGMLIIDNMIWSGRIFDSEDQSEATRGVREVTRMLAEDPAWITSLVPIRDGLLVAMKR